MPRRCAPRAAASSWDSLSRAGTGRSSPTARASCPRRRRTRRSTTPTSSAWSSSCCGRRAAPRSSCPAATPSRGRWRRATAAKGARAFDWDFLGRRVFGQPIQVKAAKKLPPARETQRPLGRHLEGCRIGFDLGGSDRKAAAVIDGKVVFSDEVKWNPYFEKDPAYHLEGVNDSIRRAARAPAADRRDRRQRRRGLREQRAARGLALPRHLGARLRPPHPGSLPRAAAVVGRRAVRGGERRRGDGARRLDVAALERRARHLARDQHRRRLRHARGQHHALAQRAGVRPRSTTARAPRPTSGRGTPASARSTSRSRP